VIFPKETKLSIDFICDVYEIFFIGFFPSIFESLCFMLREFLSLFLCDNLFWLFNSGFCIEDRIEDWLCFFFFTSIFCPSFWIPMLSYSLTTIGLTPDCLESLLPEALVYGLTLFYFINLLLNKLELLIRLDFLLMQVIYLGAELLDNFWISCSSLSLLCSLNYEKFYEDFLALCF